ncbi:MAG: hypothetical protein LBD48_13435 [Treponema sp.]|nr:hypothetical protein [Treponema sp.]
MAAELLPFAAVMGILHIPKKTLFALLLPFALASGGCTSINYTSSVAGVSDYATLVFKSFFVLGTVTASAVETHSAGPFGFVKSVEGSKVTYNDLVRAAAQMEADDIVDVRIDVNTAGTTSFVDWITGWTRTFTYTGTALAIKYLDMPYQEYSPETTEDEENADPLNFFRR